MRSMISREKQVLPRSMIYRQRKLHLITRGRECGHTRTVITVLLSLGPCNNTFPFRYRTITPTRTSTNERRIFTTARLACNLSLPRRDYQPGKNRMKTPPSDTR